MGIPPPTKDYYPPFWYQNSPFSNKKVDTFFDTEVCIVEAKSHWFMKSRYCRKNQNYKFNYKEWNTGCELMIIWFFQNCKSIYCLYWLHWIRQPPLVLLGSFPLKVTANTQLEMYPTSLLSMCGHVNYVLSLLIFSNHFFLEPKYISYFQTTYLKEKIVKNQLWKI